MSGYAYLPAAVMEALPRLSHKAARVAVVLAGHMNGDDECWPSVATIGARAGLTRTYSVTLALSELRDVGLLTIERRGQHQTNLYRWPDPAKNVGSAPPDLAKSVGSESPDPAKNAPQTPRKTRGRTVPGTGERNGGPEQTPASAQIAGSETVPLALRNLQLYAVDAKLCARWPELIRTWEGTYLGMDVIAEVKKAHAWEVANPKKRKKDRAAFLGSWLSRATIDPAAAAIVAKRDADSLAYMRSGRIDELERLATKDKP